MSIIVTLPNGLETYGSIDPNMLLSPVKEMLADFQQRMLSAGVPGAVYSTYRSSALQNALYAMGRTTLSEKPCEHVLPDGTVDRRTPGTCTTENYPDDPVVHPLGRILTNATGGNSAHQYGLAFDWWPTDPVTGMAIYTSATLPTAIQSVMYAQSEAAGLDALGSAKFGQFLSGDWGHMQLLGWFNPGIKAWAAGEVARLGFGDTPIVPPLPPSNGAMIVMLTKVVVGVVYVHFFITTMPDAAYAELWINGKLRHRDTTPPAFDLFVSKSAFAVGVNRVELRAVSSAGQLGSFFTTYTRDA